MTKEVAINATYGTNNAGIQKFVVLAKLDGTEAPLAYFFFEKDVTLASVFLGTLTQILDQFLRYLCQAGLFPSFLCCDKDKSELNATQ